EHRLVLTMHHAVSDGWSTGVLLGELSAVYGAYVEGRKSPLSELPLQYADFALWQREQWRTGAREEEREDWDRELASLPEVLELPTDRARPARQRHRGATLRFEVEEALVRSLRELGRRENATLFMVLLGAFQVLLLRHSGQEDIAVGTPIAGR